MDEQLEEIVTGLVERVKESQEYREYRRMHEIIHQDPDKERAVNEYSGRFLSFRNAGTWICLLRRIAWNGNLPPCGRSLMSTSTWMLNLQSAGLYSISITA